jgi:stearoyl-CoA desaturase (delta-9 desaturase)
MTDDLSSGGDLSTMAALHATTSVAAHDAPLDDSPVDLPRPDVLPTVAQRKQWKISWPYAVSIVLMHVVALLAFVPWFFSWTGVVVCVLGFYVFGTLGINLCYHRLLTHRGFGCPQWLERAFAVLGVCCLQDSPARWVAIHRLHHQFSDEENDPHSPVIVRLFWAHMGWLFYENPLINNAGTYERYARDLLKDPFYFWFERKLRAYTTTLWQLPVFFGIPFLLGWMIWGSATVAYQYGMSVVLWGVVVRTVAVWHITWSVNSLSHAWGYQTYKTGEHSQNNWFVALVSNGEGWHNNHHADQRSARHGHDWWEFDVTYLTIRMLAFVGLAHEVLEPRRNLARDKV